MSYSFRPAIREQVGLLIGLIGPSGSGKTYSAMRLAAGIVGIGNRFAVIDTEAGRSRHYADQFEFDVCDLAPPFRPDAYAEAIRAADKAGYKAIVVDSVSHEWAGEGGVLEWQDEELDRMAGDDYRKREACKMAAWIKPKTSHKAMIQKLLQTHAQLILCFRAEEKVKMEKDQNNRTVIVPQGFQPICSKEMPYELTCSFLMLPDKPGVGQALKLQEQHKAMFPTGALIDENSGKRIAEWAAGGAKRTTATSAPSDSPPPASAPQNSITADQEIFLADELKRKNIAKETFLIAVSKGVGIKIDHIAQLPADFYERAKKWIENHD